MGRVRLDIAEQFELDPDLTHLNHGAFGAVPRAVREAQDRARARIERAPMRAFRDDLPVVLADARSRAAAFLGLTAGSTALVRNVTEAVGVVLQGLDIGPGDDVVVSNHGYLTAGWSAEARGATLRTASFPVDADPAKVAAAFAAAVTERTRLVVVDQITSPTALVLPVAEVAAAVAPVPVLVDAAHVPGALPALDVEALGVAFWAGNLHKWAYSPRAAATLGGTGAPRSSAAARHLVEPRPAVPREVRPAGHGRPLGVGRRARRPRHLARPRRVGPGRAQRRAARPRCRARAVRARHGQPARRHTVRPLPAARRPPGGCGVDDPRTPRRCGSACTRPGSSCRRLRSTATATSGSRQPRTTTRTTTSASRRCCPACSPPEPTLDAALGGRMWKDRATAGTRPRGGPAP